VWSSLRRFALLGGGLSATPLYFANNMKKAVIILSIILSIQNTFGQFLDCFQLGENFPKEIIFDSTILITHLDTIGLAYPNRHLKLYRRHLSINVIDKITEKIIQEIHESSEFPNNIFGLDVNIDGFKDLIIHYEKGAFNYSSIWLFHSLDNMFYYSTEFSKLNVLGIDEKKKEIISSPSDYIHEDPIVTTYKVMDRNELKIIKKEYWELSENMYFDSFFYFTYDSFPLKLSPLKGEYTYYRLDTLIGKKFITIKEINTN